MNQYDKLLDLFCDRNKPMYALPYKDRNDIYAANDNAMVKVFAAQCDRDYDSDLDSWFPLPHVQFQYYSAFQSIDNNIKTNQIIHHEALEFFNENDFNLVKNFYRVPSTCHDGLNSNTFKFGNIHIHKKQLVLLVDAMDALGLSVITRLTNRPDQFNLFSLGIAFILLKAVIPDENATIIDITKKDLQCQHG